MDLLIDLGLKGFVSAPMCRAASSRLSSSRLRRFGPATPVNFEFGVPVDVGVMTSDASELVCNRLSGCAEE